MKQRKAVLFSLLAATLGAYFPFAKGSGMTKNGPYHVTSFKDFDVESQNFVLGLGSEDFQISVPDGEFMDQVSLSKEGNLVREKIKLAEYGIVTSYVALPVSQGLLLFQGSGISLFSHNGNARLWRSELGEDRWGPRLDGPVHGMKDGSCVVWVRGRENSDDIQQVRFFQEKGKEQVLLTLPDLTPAGPLYRLYLHDGFVATWTGRKWIEGDHAQFYDWEGQPTPHPMARAWNLLHRQKIDLHSASLSPTWGSFYPSQTQANWGLFPWKEMPGFPDKRLFLLSVTDTVQAVPVTCDRMSLEPNFSLDNIVVHPHLDLFLVVAKYTGSDSNEIFLGRVRKDPAGEVYRAETYRVGSFPEVVSPIFSRNGQVLLFAMRDGRQTNLVFSRLDDLVADVNRRYPEAKFDLKELEGSPHGR